MSCVKLAIGIHFGTEPGRAAATAQCWAPGRDGRWGSVVLGGSAGRIDGGWLVRGASGRRLAGPAPGRA
jgi:hypothetical protein